MNKNQKIGLEAIESKEEDDSVVLNKYNDPIEDARENLSVEEAREIVKEDPSLIYAKIVGERFVSPPTFPCILQSAEDQRRQK